MKGYLLTFYTQQNRTVHGQSLAQWLIEQARELGVGGATIVAASEGYGHDRKLHSVHFFELSDQPIEIIMAVEPEVIDKIFVRLNEYHINAFYTLAPVEFGMSGEWPD